MKTFGSVVAMFAWLAGIILAQGFWSTFFAVIFPFWGYYLVAERIVIKYLL
jgi:uncharacterized membrane protein